MAGQDRILEEWIKENTLIERWLENFAKSTRERYKQVAFRYFSWLKENGNNCNPEELINLQKVAIGDARYKQLDKIQEWIRSFPGSMRVGTKKMMYSCIRSFYAYRRAELPRDKAFKIRSETAPVEGILTVESLKKVILSSNLMYQSVFMVMFQGGMGWQQFEHFNEKGWQQIKDHILNEEDHKPILIRLPARKHGGSYNRQPFYTFIGYDAQQLIRRYVKGQRGRIREGEALFLNEKGKPLQRSDARKFFTRHAKACGLISDVTPLCPHCKAKTRRTRQKVNGKHKVLYVCECGYSVSCDDSKLNEFKESFKAVRHGINLHEIRDVYRSTWEISSANPKLAEFCLGHDIDPNSYNKFFRNQAYCTTEFKKAQSYLNILSEDPTKIRKEDFAEILAEKEAEIQQLHQNGINKSKDIRGLNEQLQQLRSEMKQTVLTTNENAKVMKSMLASMYDAGLIKNSKKIRKFVDLEPT